MVKYELWYRDEWLATTKVVRSSVSSTPQMDEGSVWRKPIGNILKCNCDAAIFVKKDYTGMSYILCNNHGDFLGCFASKRYGVLLLKEAEAYGLREAVRWVLRMGLNHVIFELDNKAIVDLFYSLKLDDSKFGVIIQDCQYLSR